MIDVVNMALRAFSLACAMTRVRVRHAIKFGNYQCDCSSQPISRHLKRQIDWTGVVAMKIRSSVLEDIYIERLRRYFQRLSCTRRLDLSSSCSTIRNQALDCSYCNYPLARVSYGSRTTSHALRYRLR